MVLRNSVERRGWVRFPVVAAVLLGVLVAWCSCAVLAADEGSGVSGEDARDQRVELVISYMREETPKEDAAANIIVIKREEIEKIPAHDAAEVLQYTPGVNVFFSTGLNGLAQASIQGSEARQVAVFVDGVRLNLLANPSADLRTIPTDIIQRIEVVEGAASSAWGSALGGVINIVTREPDPTHTVQAETTNWVGEFGTFRNAETITGTIGRWGYFAALSHKESDGFMENTAYRQDDFYAKINYAPNPEGRLSFVASYDRGRSEDPVVSRPDFWDEIRNSRFYQRFLFEQAFSNGVAFALEGRHQKTTYDVNDIYIDPMSRRLYYDYSEETVGLSARASHTGNRNRFLMGFDGDWGTYDYVEPESADDHGIPTGNWALYGNDTYSLGQLVLNGGLRLDSNRDFGSELSPSIGAVYHLPWKGALLKAQVARGYFAPPLRWVRDSTYGDPNLKPETSINAQVGAEIRPWKFLSASVNLFRAEIDNMIRMPQWGERYENIDQVTRKGVEGELKAIVTSWLALTAGFSLVDARNDTTHQPIETVPRKTYTLGASTTWRWMTHSIVGRYLDYDTRGDWMVVGGNTIRKNTTDDQDFVLDYLFKAHLPLGGDKVRMDAFFAVHDLTNTGFQYSYKYPQPGRWIETGLTMGF